MIVVTGGAGFIGSNLISALNRMGRTDILVVDDLTDGKKFVNLACNDIADYVDKHDFIDRIRTNSSPKAGSALDNIEVIFHQGACSTTTEWDGQYMMENNYEYSKTLLHFCLEKQIPLIYASSAAVYGNLQHFTEQPSSEAPLNVYGYSKLLFDNYVRERLDYANSQIVGLRYFNVYGPHEQHKGSMASVAYHFNQQLRQDDEVRLFAGSEGYADGEQRRDFVFVDDVVALNIWFWQNADKSGIFNAGTGRSQTFNNVADSVLAFHGRGKKTYIPFPEHLMGAYQSYTQADLTQLRAMGCKHEFKTVEQGVAAYLDYLA